MGKGRQRPQPGTAEALAADLAEARDLLRQVHEAMRDARQLLRDLNAARSDIGPDVHKQVHDIAAAEVASLQIEIVADIVKTREALTGMYDLIRDQAATLAGVTTPQKFLGHVTENVMAGLKPAIADVVDKATSRYLEARFGDIDVDAAAGGCKPPFPVVGLPAGEVRRPPRGAGP